MTRKKKSKNPNHAPQPPQVPQSQPVYVPPHLRFHGDSTLPPQRLLQQQLLREHVLPSTLHNIATTEPQHGAGAAAYFNPQALSFAPSSPPAQTHGRTRAQGSLNEEATSHTISPQSRYNLRSSNRKSGQPVNGVAATHILQSIERNEGDPSQRSSKQPARTTLRSQRVQRSLYTPAPEQPKVSSAYLARSNLPSERLSHPRKLLVVLDLNGTLCVRYGLNKKNLTRRPGLEEFLDYVFANHKVVVWTSAKPANATRMAEKLLTEQQRKSLVALLARDTLRLTHEQYNTKVQLYKNLEWIWQRDDVNSTSNATEERWDMANTILIDDSIIKAKAQPHNLIQIPEFENHRVKPCTAEYGKETAIMWSVIDKLEQLKWQANVASLIREWSDGVSTIPGKDDGTALLSRPGTLAKGAQDSQSVPEASYPTPQSMNSRDTTDDDDDDDEYGPENFKSTANLPLPKKTMTLPVRGVNLAKTETTHKPILNAKPPSSAIKTQGEAKSDEDDEEEDDPESFQGVKLDQPVEKPTGQKRPRTRRREKKAAAGKIEQGDNRERIRSQSPVSEEAFKFLHIGEASLCG